MQNIIMEVLSWIIFGAMSGWMASVILEYKNRKEFFGNMLLGILGATFAGLCVSVSGYYGIAVYNSISVLVTVGSISLLIGIRYLFGERKGVRLWQE